MTTATSEAVRNLVQTPRRTLLSVLAVALAASSLGIRESHFVAELRDLAQRRVAAGEFIYVVDAEGAELDGAACERLGTIAGVLSAGVERVNGDVVFGSHPSAAYRLVEVTPGRAAIAGLVDPPTAVVVGGAVAAELGLPASLMVEIAGEDHHAVATHASGARSASIDRAVWVLTPPALAKGICYVEFDSVTAQDALAILPALLADDVPGGANVRPLVDPDSLGPDPVELARTRPDRGVWVLFAALTCLFVAVMLRSRRMELATYALAGATRPWIVAMLVFEHLVVMLVAIASALVVVSATQPQGEFRGLSTIVVVARYAVSTTCGCLLLFAATSRRTLRLYEYLRRAD